MSSSIIDSTQTDATPSVESGAPHHRVQHRAWLVAVALVAVVTLAWQATAGASPTTGRTNAANSVAVQADPAVSTGAGLLALAWELTPPSQRGAACAQFSADPAAAWAAYSAGADAASIATRAELTAFLGVRC